MQANRVKQLWREGKPVATGWCGTPDPYFTEIMARAGFDALILDMQHGMAIGPDRAAVWLQIVGQTDTVPIVRIPWNEPAYAQWALDAGAMGIIVPMVNSVEDARKAIGACRYPPVGYRSNGANRAGIVNGSDYFAHANEEIICLPMMETEEGVAAIEEIAALPGCDGFFIGPTDLAISMGLAPEIDHKDERHVALVQRVADVSKARGLTSGIFIGSAEEAGRRFRQGFNLNPVAVDAFLFSGALKQSLADFRRAVEG